MTTRSRSTRSTQTPKAAAGTPAAETAEIPAAENVETPAAVATVAAAAPTVIDDGDPGTPLTVETAPSVTEIAAKSVEETMSLTAAAIVDCSEAAARQLKQPGLDGAEAFNTAWECGQAMTRGAEQISRSLMAFTQAAMDRQMAAATALVGAKTLHEFAETQSEVVREAIDSCFAEATHLSDILLRVGQEMTQPMTARAKAMADQVAADTSG